MNILLSINKKFFEKTPEELVKLIKKYDNKKIIKGFEMYINFEEENERNYMREICKLCKKESYIFQIHGMDCNYSNQFEYLDFVNELTTIIQKDINILMHPVSEENIEKSILETEKYFKEIINYIEKKKYNINVGIENLNYKRIERLNKNNIVPILKKIDNLNFTYDMGHVIIDDVEITGLDGSVVNKINNVHMHTFKEKEDHHPIGLSNDVSPKWEKCLQYLKNIQYDKSMVLEYNFYILGSNYEERLTNYIKSANRVKDYYNNCI